MPLKSVKITKTIKPRRARARKGLVAPPLPSAEPPSLVRICYVRCVKRFILDPTHVYEFPKLSSNKCLYYTKIYKKYIRVSFILILVLKN